MRINEIEIGQRVWTRVSGERVAVAVVGFDVDDFNEARRRMRKVRVRRLDTGKVLPKARSAQALHVSDGARGEWPSLSERQDGPVSYCAHNIDEREACDACNA